MAKKIVPSEFKTHLIEQFIESITEDDKSNYYAFVGDHLTQGSTESEVDEPIDNIDYLNSTAYQNMIFGKKITNNDVKIMVKRYDWTSNTVYEMYDDETVDLYDKNFYVMVDEVGFKHVYKCLYNANNSPSTVRPTFSDVRFDENLYVAGDDYYETSDGYQWKYMYSVDATTFNKFATQNYIPVVANTSVNETSVNGSVDVVKVVTHGRNYNNYIISQFTENSITAGTNVQYLLPSDSSKVENFYANTILFLISGTGAGQYRRVLSSKYDEVLSGVVINLEEAFVVTPDQTTKYELTPEVEIISNGTETVKAYARAVINSNASNSVHIVEILDPGENYNYATARVLVGTPAGENGLDTGTTIEPTPATVRPIISPPGGHGANTAVELGGKSVCIYTKFDRDELGTVLSENSFSQYGIIRDPLFANVEIHFVKKSNGFEGSDGTFLVDEKIRQFKKLKLYGTVGVEGQNNTIESTLSDTQYDEYFSSGDFVYITDEDNETYNFLGQVNNVINSTALELKTSPDWTSSAADMYFAKPFAEATILSRTSSSINVGKTLGNFVKDELIIGENTQAVANISGIDINNRYGSTTSDYSFSTINQMIKLTGTLGSGISFENDERVFQGTDVENATMTGYVHSSNSTHLFLTNVNGTPNTAIIVSGESSGAILSAPFDKYSGDLDATSGEVIYLQNDVPVTRNVNQSEEIRVILEF